MAEQIATFRRPVAIEFEHKSFGTEIGRSMGTDNRSNDNQFISLKIRIILLIIKARPSPIGAQTSPNSDLDEFDIITNRSKSTPLNGSNNNNCMHFMFDDV